MTNAGSIKYREATPGDQRTLDEMNIAASFGAIKLEAEYPDVDAFLAKHPDVAKFSKEFGREGDIGIIAEDDDGQPVGAIWGREHDRTDEDEVLEYPFELTVAVKETARNHGIGRQLLDSFAVMAEERGHSGISLGVHYKSPARRLYEAAGYEPLMNEDGTEARIDGRYIPMVKRLNTKSR